MRNPIVKRITAGLAAAMLMLTNVLLPVQPVFADGPQRDVQVQNGADKVFVCKYVSTPEENETPSHVISVSVANKDYEPGDLFVDAQRLSYVLAKDIGQEEPSVDECPTFLKPVEPPVVDPCNPVEDPQASNIRWGDYQDTEYYYWVLNNDGSLTLTAQEGYFFKTSDTTYSSTVDYQLPMDSGLLCEDQLVSIPLSLPSNDPCGLDNAYLITTALDSIENISYVENDDDGSVMVTADEGYRLIVDGELTPDYKNYTYLAPEDSNELCEALSEGPKFVDQCGTTNDYFVVEKTEYVEYYNGDDLLKAGKKYYVADASEVTITAKVTNEDYEIVNDTVYTHQFTDEPCVELDAKAWCDDLDTKIKVVLTNTTKKQQKLEVVITSGDDEVYSEVVRLKKNETETLYTKIAGDGEFTVSVYAMKGKKRGELLTQKIVETVCVDTFTPEIYKKNQDGAILSTGTFDVEVCQNSSEFDRMVMGEEQDGCTTYEDVMFGTDGSWFANNVDYERNVPTTVTITETEAPVGCKMSTTPWVFTWSYSDVQLMNYYHMSGSWDTKDGTNVFNLYNDCDKPGQGEYTPDPVTPVVPVEVETLADTGESENAILAVAAGMLLASVGLALSPRLYRGEA